MKIPSSFTYPHVIPILYDTIFVGPTSFLGILELQMEGLWVNIDLYFGLYLT